MEERKRKSCCIKREIECREHSFVNHGRYLSRLPASARVKARPLLIRTPLFVGGGEEEEEDEE